MGVGYKPERDPDGRSYSRPVASKKGWSAQLHSISLSTSDLDSCYNKDKDDNDLGFTTYKLYDAQDAEITLEANEVNAVKTVLEWAPNYDYEIIGGSFKQSIVPVTNIHAWVIGVPDLTPAQGGSVPFADGGMNLKFTGTGAVIDFDGRASKFLPYQTPTLPDGWTNKLQFTLRHTAGVKHDLQIMLEIFKG